MTTGPVALGPIIQIAWVTDDIAATESLLRDQFGSGPWTRIPDVHFDAEHSRLRGTPTEFTAHISLAYAGDLQLELIEPVSGESVHTEFLARCGPGLHHVCYAVDDLGEAIARAEAAGLAVLQTGTMMDGEIEFAYLDGSSGGAPYVELARIGPQMAALFEAIRSG
jgi:catechol 2,3-dioxygenase-like lactoylglutathione lyase family enzyme